MALRVLIIDDDEVTVEGLTEALTLFGYEVFTAADGRLGKVMTRACDPDVVLLDMRLPGEDGIEILRALRRNRNLEHVAIIIFSGDAAPAIRERALAAGADRFVLKPIGLLELKDAIEAVTIEKRKGTTGGDSGRDDSGAWLQYESHN